MNVFGILVIGVLMELSIERGLMDAELRILPDHGFLWRVHHHVRLVLRDDRAASQWRAMLGLGFLWATISPTAGFIYAASTSLLGAVALLRAR